MADLGGESLLQQQMEALKLEEQASAKDVASVACGSKMQGIAGDGEDQNVCPICLDNPRLEDVAMVKGCEHTYCVKCILHWAVHKENAWCPQCKVPFSHLYTYFALDGTLRDYPMEESVCLLKRAVWFQDHIKVVDKGKVAVVGPELSHEDWDDCARYYEEYDEDQEVEDFYFSAAAGSARIVIGNRRWGTGGFVSAGRKQARPVPKPNKAVGKDKSVATETQTPSPPCQAPPQKSRSVQHCSSSGSSGSSSKPGRRARRNARRVVADDGEYD